MRVLSWVGAFLIMIGVAGGTVAVLRPHPHPAHALSASRLVSAAAPYAGPVLLDPKPPPQISPGSSSAATPPVAPPAPPQPAPPPPAPLPAPAAIVVGSAQQQLINQDRGGAGLGALNWSSCLAGVARSNAARMASQGFISHTDGPNVDLTCGLGHQAGENVGYWTGGVNDAQLNSMFMKSPEHHANIMGPYRYTATIWVTAPNGTAFIAVEFG
jgi:uncharacterized protein YkwD